MTAAGPTLRNVAIVLMIAVLVTMRDDVTAQPQAPKPLQFEVASIRESKSDDRRASRRFLPGGRVEITNFSLRRLIGFSHGIDTSAEEFRVVGGPDSLLDRRFDITAVAPAGSEPPPADLMAMLRALLGDRFSLKLHTEGRPMSAYALRVVEKGTLGPRLRSTEHNCRDWSASDSGLETQPSDENGPLCDFDGQLKILPGGVRRRFAGTIATLAQLIQQQAPELHDRRVVDLTGLTGNYIWDVSYSQNMGRGEPDGSLPSVFTAFREQLGLKLEPDTAPVEVLVIDSVTMPSPN